MQLLIMILGFLSYLTCSTDVGVIAFFQTECPQGWEPYLAANNKFILAQGNKYTIGETGGSDTVTLTVEQMPSHSHGNREYNRLLRLKSDCDWTAPASDVSCGEPDIISSQPMSSTGGNQPSPNMPPYIVLKACKKVNETKVDCTNQFISCDIQRFQNLQKSLGLTDDGIAAFKTKMTTELAAKQAEIAALKVEKDAHKIELSNKITETNTLYNAASIMIKELNSSLVATQIKVDLLSNLKSTKFQLSLVDVQVLLFLLLVFAWQ